MEIKADIQVLQEDQTMDIRHQLEVCPPAGIGGLCGIGIGGGELWMTRQTSQATPGGISRS